jgi:uncharacterized repeat protein (TIGR03803 family)
VKFIKILILLPSTWVIPFYALGGVAFTTLISFDSGTTGANPHCKLIQDSQGNFYGTAFLGGSNYYGTVFKINSGGNLKTLVSFDGTNGAEPWSGLVRGKDGDFYGTTQGGGTNIGSLGTVFRISTNGTFTSLVSFAGTNGINPNGLALGGDGNFYGGTAPQHDSSETYGRGTIFQMTPDGELTTLNVLNGTNGAFFIEPPPQPFVLGNDGNLYGTTQYGGTNDLGTIFQMTTNGSLTTLILFSGTNGANPNELAQAGDGSLYGTTQYGGANGQGTVFKMTTNGILTVLYSFSSLNHNDENADGAQPISGLVQGNDGNFYGTTSTGGAHGFGTIFNAAADGELITLYSFGTLTNFYGHPLDGSNPNALTIGKDGNFYGTTYNGGTNNNIANNGDGTVFRLSVPMPPAFQKISQTNGIFSITWSTVASQAYQLQYTTNLNSTNWINLGNTNVATDDIMSATDSVGLNLQRFYRVMLP